jgi:nitroreductase
MEFQDIVRRRRMVRQFAPQAVPHNSIGRILANAVRGPSVGFSQGQAFLVLTGDDLPRFWGNEGPA